MQNVLFDHKPSQQLASLLEEPPKLSCDQISQSAVKKSGAESPSIHDWAALLFLEVDNAPLPMPDVKLGLPFSVTMYIRSILGGNGLGESGLK